MALEDFDFDLDDLDDSTELEKEDRIRDWLAGHGDQVARFRHQRQRWLDWIGRKRRYVLRGLKSLADSGCEEDRLVFYLCYLRPYGRAGHLTKARLRALSRNLEQTIEDVFELRDSVVGMALMDVEVLDKLIADVYDVLLRLPGCLDFLGRRGKGSALLDDAKAAIVRHVRERTGGERHEEVAALIAAALEQEYSEAAHKMWVSRHAELLKTKTHHETKWLELSAAMGSSKPKP
jgi:hypothetical protein